MAISKSPVTITEERPDSPDALALLSELDAALWLHPYPQESRHAFTVDKLLRDGVAFFVARMDGEPAACGGLKLFGSDYGEVKRMYVRPVYRGRGLGKAVLNQLADYAQRITFPTLPGPRTSHGSVRADLV